MDTRDWELLLALEEEKSMTKAGERLFLSQPAVVYRLNRMEAEFGTTLFLRSNKGVQFTPAGPAALLLRRRDAAEEQQHSPRTSGSTARA